MNKERIIKDLERLVDKYGENGSYNTYCTLSDTLALIKELTEECKDFKIRALRAENEAATYEDRWKTSKTDFERLADENERLYNLVESECDHCACVLLDERDAAREEADRYKKYYFHHEYDKWEAEIKADTVRKMQDKFKEKLDISVCGYSTEDVVSDVFDTIDRVAKEVLEENK